jgi:hypothetical protein
LKRKREKDTRQKQQARPERGQNNTFTFAYWHFLGTMGGVWIGHPFLYLFLSVVSHQINRCTMIPQQSGALRRSYYMKEQNKRAVAEMAVIVISHQWLLNNGISTPVWSSIQHGRYPHEFT